MMSMLLFDQNEKDDRQVWRIEYNVPCWGPYEIWVKADDKKHALAQADAAIDQFWDGSGSFAASTKENW